MQTNDDDSILRPDKARFIHPNNINIGRARVIWSEVRQAWAIPGCRYVSSEAKAREYGMAMHKLIAGEA